MPSPLILNSVSGTARVVTFIGPDGLRHQLGNTGVRATVEDITIPTGCQVFYTPLVVPDINDEDMTLLSWRHFCGNLNHVFTFNLPHGGVGGQPCAGFVLHGGIAPLIANFYDTEECPEADDPFLANYFDNTYLISLRVGGSGTMILTITSYTNFYGSAGGGSYAVYFYAEIAPCDLIDGVVIVNQLTEADLFGSPIVTPEAQEIGKFAAAWGGQVTLEFCAAVVPDVGIGAPQCEDAVEVCEGDYKEAQLCDGTPAGLYYPHADVSFGQTWKQEDGTCVREDSSSPCTTTSEPAVDMSDPYLNCGQCELVVVVCGTEEDPEAEDCGTDEVFTAGLSSSVFLTSSGIDISGCKDLGAFIDGCYNDAVPNLTLDQTAPPDGTDYYGIFEDSQVTPFGDGTNTFSIQAWITRNTDSNCWKLKVEIGIQCIGSPAYKIADWYGIKAGALPEGSYKKCSTTHSTPTECVVWPDTLLVT